jgi:hypothetical protein
MTDKIAITFSTRKAFEMLFEHKDVFKIEWNASTGRYLIVLIEQYKEAMFDSESECFLEACGYIKEFRSVFSMNDVEDVVTPDSTNWKLSIVAGKDALKKRLLRLITTELGIKDIYSANELAEEALAKISV